MRYLAAVLLLAVALPLQARDEGKLKPLTDADFMLVLRCSQAAHIAVYAATVTTDPADRVKFALDLHKDPQFTEKLGKGAPTVPELLSASLAVGTLLQGRSGTSTPQAHDTLVGQAAATCALQARQ